MHIATKQYAVEERLSDMAMQAWMLASSPALPAVTMVVTVLPLVITLPGLYWNCVVLAQNLELCTISANILTDNDEHALC